MVRTTTAVVAACAVLLGADGCTVTRARRREPASAKAQEVLDSRHGQFDLTRPPSREEAGMLPGETEVTFERRDKQPFRVRVLLPEGRQLAFQARLLGFDSLDSPNPKTAPPTTLDVHHYPATLEAGRDHLLAAADQFGLDTDAIIAWYQEAKGLRPIAAPSTAKTPWLTATTNLGYLRMEAQGRYRPPIDLPRSDQTVVHYTLTWGS